MTDTGTAIAASGQTDSGEKRYGMLIDLSLCVGCSACAVACKIENAVPVTCFNTWVESWDSGEYPKTTRANVPKLCNHCADAPCITVCPTGATFVEEGGAVVIDRQECIGCGSCVQTCPYGARYLDAEAGRAGKCTYCFHRASQGMLPACVGTCITQARVFGDMNDPESDVSRILADADAEALRAELGLDTATRYLGLSETLLAEQSSTISRGGNKREPSH
jgi:tetrathionate reductase subunit B